MAPEMQVPGAQRMWVGCCEAWHVRNSEREHEEMDSKVGGRARQQNVPLAMWSVQVRAKRLMSENSGGSHMKSWSPGGEHLRCKATSRCIRG
jgi:hypothetical protein